MIRTAKSSDTQAVYAIWKEAFAHDDGGYIDYYFKNLYDFRYAFVTEEANEIVSTLQMRPHVMSLHGKKINASMILGVATIPQARHKGHMVRLMKHAIAIAEEREMVTFLQAYEPAVYRQFGYQIQYWRKKTHYVSDMIANYEGMHVSDRYQVQELVKVYDAFTKRFNGFFLRDAKYYQSYSKQMIAENGHIVVYRNPKNEVEGYMVYYLHEALCVVQEIIYLNSWAFLALMGYASELRKELEVHTSGAEQVDKMIAGGKSQDYQFMMARINDYPLFNICYGSSVQNVEEGFSLSKLPLFNHEYA